MDYDDPEIKEAINYTTDDVHIADIPTAHLAEEIILIIFGIIGIAANILLMYIICYYKKLHTNTNMYVINWAIAYCGSAIVTLSFFRVFESIFDIAHEILCFYVGFGFSLLFNEMLFMILLTIDWCLSAYLPRPIDKFREYTRSIIAAIWVASIVFLAISSGLCSSISTFYVEFHISLPLLYTALLIFLLVLHSVRMIQKIRKRTEYHPVGMLIIPTAFVLCRLLSWANLMFFNISYHLITGTPVFLHPIINLLLLIIVNEDFKTCFFQVIKWPNFKGCQSPSVDSERNGISNNNRGHEEAMSFDNKMFDQPTRHI